MMLVELPWLSVLVFQFFLQLQFHRLELDSEQGEGEAPLEIDQLEDSKSHSKLSITSSFQSELGSVSIFNLFMLRVLTTDIV